MVMGDGALALLRSFITEGIAAIVVGVVVAAGSNGDGGTTMGILVEVEEDLDGSDARGVPYCACRLERYFLSIIAKVSGLSVRCLSVALEFPPEFLN